LIVVAKKRSPQITQRNLPTRALTALAAAARGAVWEAAEATGGFDTA
jgi:hypothetical protein